MTRRALPSRRQAIVTFLCTAVTALMCAGLVSAAALVPAPPSVLPLVAAVCVVLPMLAAWQWSSSLALLRHRRRLDKRALQQLRQDLARLPETGHPLGL